ncbi:hypothetical protein Z949_495 [Sulfitobacter guttiformis KCTC 32187]|nr:hypothetical protein Z949_495 [Sulfitobacter guttiformis KCTC 32187]
MCWLCYVYPKVGASQDAGAVSLRFDLAPDAQLPERLPLD